MKKYILASTSPRRKELLKEIIKDFEIISPSFDEKTANKEFSYEFIEEIAEKKSDSISQNIKYPAIIISADTVVVFNNRVLGKPKDYDEAYKMLEMLNGNVHKVVTAVCVWDCETKKKLIKSETSNVEFFKQNMSEIESYIKNYKPYDKAGSYGIQELPEGFVKKVEGDYTNIVGLPVNLLKEMIEEITK